MKIRAVLGALMIIGVLFCGSLLVDARQTEARRRAACEARQDLARGQVEIIGHVAARLGASEQRQQYETDLWLADHPLPQCQT